MMRDLIDKISVLTESVGLANRKAGDTFKNAQGDKITFNALQFFPSKGGKFNADELKSALENLEAEAQVKWQNNRTTKTGGFAVATFDTDTGPVYYGFYKDSISPNKNDNYIPNQVDDFRFAGKSAEKIQSGLTPQDLLTRRDNLTSADIVDQLALKLGENNPLVAVARRVASGEEFPLRFPAPEGVSFTGFRDYFCEILQPMALQTGQYKGNAGEAAETFLGGSFADTTISFDAAKNAGLSDSILTNREGKYVKVSTKGGRGAQASSKNLIDSIDELNQTPAGKKLLDKNSDTIEIMREIQRQGQIKAPLYLGIKYDIITPEESDMILKLRNLPPVNLKNVDKLKLTSNLKKLAKERATDDPENVNLFYHLLASVAHLAAKEVNDKTNFSETAADILNNGALVQVYTKLKQGKDEWTLDPFDTVYPGKTITGVYLSASKNYFSTGIKGNFTFRINKGSEPKGDDEPETIEPSEPLSVKSKELVEPRLKRKQKAAAAGTGVGRKKRK